MTVTIRVDSRLSHPITTLPAVRAATSSSIGRRLAISLCSVVGPWTLHESLLWLATYTLYRKFKPSMLHVRVGSHFAVDTSEEPHLPQALTTGSCTIGIKISIPWTVLIALNFLGNEKTRR